jgi:hypothetical protein
MIPRPMTAARNLAGEGALPAIDRAIDEIGSGARADTLDFDPRVVIAGLERHLER